MKYILAIVITAILVFLGATFYYKGFFSITPSSKPTETPVATATPETQAASTPVAINTPGSGPTEITAGGILVFKKYSLVLPTGWESKKEYSPDPNVQIDRLILSKSGYKVTIYQAPTGGAICLYPGMPKVDGPTSNYDSYVDITTKSGEKLRKSTSGVNTNSTVCEFQSENWGAPTSFGHISIEVPGNGGTAQMVQEIDSILMSLKKA